MTIARFTRVSQMRYQEDWQDRIAEAMPLSEIPLPRRATAGSAGYDFVSPARIVLAPGASAVIPTGIRAEMEPGWVLMLFPRSGLGFRHGLHLANTVGVIDSDYAFAKNEGHILVKIVNPSDHEVILEQGERFCQGVFLPHGTAEEEQVMKSRTGGFGSTDAALTPIPMTPAFRGGKLTPWGGEKLRTVFGKAIQDVPTGESLEVSCIPGLESRGPDGRTLTEMIAADGERMAGKYAGKPFPLLLKLIDARDRLSVQVHPDDAFAQDHENGKLGKTEAWLILDAPEDGELVYGIVPGTGLAELRAASEAGSAVAPLLRRVRVRPGDVCYIPAGCVHAIGAGITLYEIQQSSDITYRFYDWDRTDERGNRRELHLDKALAVTDLNVALSPVHAPESSGVHRVLDKTYFTLDLIRSEAEEALPPIRDFGMLTALEDGLTLTWDGGSLPMKKGETCFLPGAGPALRMVGRGLAALSMPR